LARCEVKVGDVFLLCSDGVTDLLDDDDLERMLNDLADPAEAAAALIALANGRGGHDNVSVIVVRVGDGP
jgi:protein phosphatase